MRKNYCGAVGLASTVDVSNLDRSRFAVQPKIDGSYCHVHTDAEGRVFRVDLRSGKAAPQKALGAIQGALVARPNSVLVGELELYTEWATRQALAGHRRIHLFDCLAESGRDIRNQPYQSRRDMLWRMQEEVSRGGWQYWRDSRNQLHNKESGKFERFAPRDWQLMPIVPHLSAGDVAEHWERALSGEAEGLVVVDLLAPVGKRGAKRKVKPCDTIDAVVIEANNRAVRLRSFGRVFLVAQSTVAPVRIGQCVEVAHNGYYDSGEPRFARIVRSRPDKAARTSPDRSTSGNQERLALHR